MRGEKALSAQPDFSASYSDQSNLKPNLIQTKFNPIQTNHTEIKPNSN